MAWARPMSSMRTLAILDGPVGERNDHHERSDEKHTFGCDDHAAQSAFGIESDVFLVGDLVGEEHLFGVRVSGITESPWGDSAGARGHG